MQSPQPALQKRLLFLLERGMITRAEAAAIAGVRSQSVDGWLRRRGIDPHKCRDRYLREVLKLQGGTILDGSL